MKAFKMLLLTFGFLVAAQAKAGFITINESELDGIFSQSSFENKPIDIRIGKATELVFPDLLDITTSNDITKLFNQHVGIQKIVNIFFVDTITYCGGTTGSNIAGCGEYFGNDFVVNSNFAGSNFGSELLAHELGHNLGLNHNSSQVLMNGILNGQTLLESFEVDIIHRLPQSPFQLVQSDDQGFWIDINPVLIVAKASTPVPEPSTLVLLLLSVGFLVRKNIKK
mgnify:CR=1 FL=1|tara:strand:- start:233 stop:907 length:675 start_codon:yes stop_codon:yes gene_type:complete